MLSNERIAEIMETAFRYQRAGIAPRFGQFEVADVLALGTEVRYLKEHVAELKGVLRSVEWKGPVESVETEDGYRTARLCPRCLGDRLEDHAPDCALDAALRDAHE